MKGRKPVDLSSMMNLSMPFGMMAGLFETAACLIQLRLASVKSFNLRKTHSDVESHNATYILPMHVKIKQINTAPFVSWS
jgi:hypothetical protein